MWMTRALRTLANAGGLWCPDGLTRDCRRWDGQRSTEHTVVALAKVRLAGIANDGSKIARASAGPGLYLLVLRAGIAVYGTDVARRSLKQTAWGGPASTSGAR